MNLDSFSFFSLAVATEDSGDGFLLLQIIGVICGILGLIFFLGSAVGMVRFPDFCLTQLHMHTCTLARTHARKHTHALTFV